MKKRNWQLIALIAAALLTAAVAAFAGQETILSAKSYNSTGVTFANLANSLPRSGELISGQGFTVWCSDCQVATACASGGNGAWADYNVEMATWSCGRGTGGGGGGGITPPVGDICGSTGSPTVCNSHLTNPLPNAQGGTATNYGAPAYFIQLNNDASTGTVAGGLVTESVAGNAITPVSGQTKNIIGVCVAGCGTSGTATIQTSGIAGCISASSVTLNDYVGVGASGNCTDLGSSTSSTNQIVGRFTASAVSCRPTCTVNLFPGEQRINVAGLPASSAALGAVSSKGTSVQTPLAANITVSKPASVVSGHTMIMGYYSQIASVPTLSGWTLIRSDSCNSGNIGTLYKVAGNSEPSSYTFTLATSYNAASIIDVGVTASNPVDVISPPVCGVAPTISGLNISNQSENVITFGFGTNGNVPTITFSAGTMAAQVAASGILPLGVDFLTANYPTSPSLTLPQNGGTQTAAQMIAIAPSGTYSQRPILQGDGYAEVTKLHGTFGADASISHFNIGGNFNVKNPIYGAQGDGLTDDTAAIQAAFNAACAQGAIDGTAETVFFQKGIYLTSSPIISNCANPINWRCETEKACVVQATTGALYPIFMHEGSNYLSNMNTAAGGSVFGTALATGAGGAMVWGTGSFQFYDLEDAWPGNAAYSLGGASAYTVEGFFNYSGGAVGGNNIYLLDSTGDDLNLGASNAIAIYLVTGYYLEACTTTTGSGHVCTSNNSNAITPGTTYEFEASYDGSNLRLFYGIPGATTTLAGSHAATGTIIQKASEVFALGDGGSGMLMTGENLQTNAHWIGSVDSIRLSNTARNTSTYTAPTTKFGHDGNTILLLNNETQVDVFDKASFVGGLGTPVYLPLHSNQLAGGNTHGGFYNMGMAGGSYSVLGIGSLYTTFDHVQAGGAAHYGIKMFNNCYGTQINHLTVAATPFAQSGLTMSYNSGLTQLNWIFQTGSYYGMQMVDSGGTYTQLFLNPGASQVAAIDIGGTNLFHSYEIGEADVDFESGGAQVPVKLWGSENTQFLGGDWQPGTTNVADIAPGGGGSTLTTTWIGGNVVTSGTAALWHWAGSNPPASPATWINPTVNGSTVAAYVASGGSFTDVPAYAALKPAQAFTLTGATPTLVVQSGGDTDAIESDNEILGAGVSGLTTLTLFAAGATAPADGKVFHLKFTQPSGGHSYTLALSAGSGVNLTYPTSGGCPSLPTMPTGTGHTLALSLLYDANPATPQVMVMNCVPSGS